MATVSLCMIVKNEERVLRRCLDSICDIVDEIIIVDTGSTDSTKEIASEYTDKVYDFKWVDDFSAARNFSFSKCTKDYIYVADADEYLDEANRTQFKILKDNIYDEIEIVQMMYETVSNDTVLNVYREYRPKLFKRLREFVWINPVHETVRLDPLVFDSDVVITHAPESNHSSRDFSIFEKTIDKDGTLPDDLIKMYATELYKNGDFDDFKKASTYYSKSTDIDTLLKYNSEDADFPVSVKDYYSIFINAKWLRLSNNESFSDYAKKALKLLDDDSSEIYFELGEHCIDSAKYEEAADWFSKAVSSSSSLDVHTRGDYALKKLILCCEKVIAQYNDYCNANGTDKKMEELISEYTALLDKYSLDLNNWKMPEELTV